MKASEYIEFYLKKIDEKTKEVKKIEDKISITNKILEHFSDLEIERNSFYSLSVNKKANKVFFSIYTDYSGYEDSQLEAYIYVECCGERIYSKPRFFIIGDFCKYSGFSERYNWEKELQDVNIPKKIIDEINEKIEKKDWF